MKNRIWMEDALKYVHESAYRKRPPTPEGLAGALGMELARAGQLLDMLQGSGLVSFTDGQYRLTKRGREYARQVLRAHRLYETYLSRQTGFDEMSWHAQAEVKEHELTGRDVASIAEELGDPRFDPHGDPIPTAAGEIPPLHGRSLLACPPGWEGRIVHVEDEPSAAYRAVVEQGLAPGTRLRILDRGDATVQLRVEGGVVALTMSEADAIRVAALVEGEAVDEEVERLSALSPGETADVAGLSPSCRGAERDRLLDLGLVPGTGVTLELAGSSGALAAYRVRGALLALRKEQTDKILIRRHAHRTEVQQG